jgi:uncharacterized membrane protein
MESKVKLFGHPLHQMLVMFPVGLLGTSAVFDLMHLLLGRPGAAEVAYALISAGIIAGLIAAPWGTIDWLSIPKGTRAKRIGAAHGLGNGVMLGLFALSWWLRQEQAGQPSTLAIVLALAGVGLSLVTAWLGGELVARLGIGVSPHAHPDARNSLAGPALPASARPASPAQRTGGERAATGTAGAAHGARD